MKKVKQTKIKERIDLIDYEKGLDKLREARGILEKIVGEPAIKFINLSISETQRDYEVMASLILYEKKSN